MLKCYQYWSQEHSSSKISSYWVPNFGLFLLKRSISPVINHCELLLCSALCRETLRTSLNKPKLGL